MIKKQMTITMLEAAVDDVNKFSDVVRSRPKSRPKHWSSTMDYRKNFKNVRIIF